MNRTIYILAAVLLLLTAGCTREPDIDRPSNSDGKVRLELQLRLGESEQQTTRADAGLTDATLGSDIYVLVLDGNQSSSKLKQKPVRACEVKNSTIYAVLDEETTDSYLCLLAATMPSTMTSYLDNAAVGTTLSDLQANLQLPLATSAGLSLPLPMTGWSDKIAKITKNGTYNTVQLVRAVARINVKIADAVTTDNFTLTGLALVTGARKGWLIQPDEIAVQSGAGVVQYDAVAPASGENKIEGKIYCYENNGQSSLYTENPTRVVVIGKYNGSSQATYYGINIAYVTDPQDPKTLSYDIRRNKTYTVLINKVQKSGYASMDEAINNPEFNMSVDAEILVTDPYAHEIVTNGKQYLGTTNSAFLTHPNTTTGNMTGVAIATISYTTESSWSAGQITLPLDLSFTSGTNGRLELSSGNTPVVKEIVVDIPASFSSGDIQISIGNLSQTIHVRRNGSISALGGICNDFATEEYKVGEVVNASESTSWVKLSDSEEPDGESSLLDKITVPKGGIYVHFESNVGFEGTSKPREAQLYISGGQGQPRTRILVQQNSYEIYKDASERQIEKSYVGTFHRWNQTAERVIRMDASAFNTETSTWTATIVSGKDFIVLSKEPSPDPRIEFDDPFGDKHPEGPLYATDEEIEANCQVSGNATTVSGTGKYINFRVGLKSKLASASAQPRYGLIAVIHSNGGGNHLIYVRQGEAPDYLMRPWDEWKERGSSEGTFGTAHGNTRNEVFKICPYNLTDPLRSSVAVDRGTRGYGFTDYPSQAGYYFPAVSTKAFPFTETTNLDTYNYAVWQDSFEGCPRGYRRPKEIPPVTGGIEGSECRLSLWLYPRAGSAQSSITNQYRGYLADGYFDRRMIGTPTNGVSGTGPQTWSKHTRVYDSNKPTEVAFHGTLLYNPKNLASVFIPEAGSVNASWMSWGAKGVITQGYWGGFWTSTNYISGNSGYYWLVNSGMLNATSTIPTFDFYQNATIDFGWSVRCVKDENPPILNGDDDNTVEPFPDSGTGDQVDMINYEYLEGANNLQTQLETVYGTAELGNVRTLYLYGPKTLTDEDYAYLNSLATDKKVCHLVLSGTGNLSIPAQAFTSPNWISISLFEANTIASGAFNFTAGSDCSLVNVKFGSYDAINIPADGTAFYFPAGFDPSKKINLFLAGTEYDGAKTSKQWAGRTWYSVKNYFGNK